MLLLLVKVLFMLPPISPTATPQGQRRRSVVMAIKSIVKHVVDLQAVLTVSRRRRTSRYVATSATSFCPFVIKSLDHVGWVVGAVRRATQKVIGKIAVLNLL